MRTSLFLGGFILLALSTAAMADLADPGITLIGHDPAAISINLIGDLQPSDPDIYFENTTPFIVDELTFTTTIDPADLTGPLSCSSGGYFKGGLVDGFSLPTSGAMEGCAVIVTPISSTAEKLEYVFGGVNPADGDEYCLANGKPKDTEIGEREGIPPCGIFEAQLTGFTPTLYGPNPQNFTNEYVLSNGTVFESPEPPSALLLAGELGLFFAIVQFLRRRKSAFEALARASQQD